MKNNKSLRQKNNQLSYWVYMVIFWIIGVWLAMFVQDLLYGWGNPKIVTTFAHIKSRLGEVIAFGMSVVVVLYSIIMTSLLLFGIYQPGLKNLNYKVYSKTHSLVFFAVLFYAIAFFVVFYKF